MYHTEDRLRVKKCDTPKCDRKVLPGVGFCCQKCQEQRDKLFVIHTARCSAREVYK